METCSPFPSAAHSLATTDTPCRDARDDRGAPTGAPSRRHETDRRLLQRLSHHTRHCENFGSYAVFQLSRAKPCPAFERIHDLHNGVGWEAAEKGPDHPTQRRKSKSIQTPSIILQRQQLALLARAGA